jgi:thioredoxin 1
MGSIYEEFGKTQETVNLVKVDVDKNQAIAQPYNIMSIPTILLFKDGEVVAQKMGTMTLNELKEFSNS